MRRAVERAELRRRAVPDVRPLRDAGLAVLLEAGFAVLRDVDFAVLRDAGLAVLRDAGLDAEERLAVPRFAVVERLPVEELLLAAELRAPPPAFRVLLACLFGALPLRLDPVVRFDELDFGCGILLAPLQCDERREATGKRIQCVRAVMTAEVAKNTHRDAERDAASAALDRLLEHVMTTVQADRSLLLLRDERRPGTTVAAAGAGYDPSPIGRRFALDRGMAGEVLRTGEPVIVADYAELDRRIDFGCSRRPYAAMAAPVVTGGVVVGIVAAVGCTAGWQPGAEECEVLSNGAELLGRALPALGARTPVSRRVAELHAELAAHDDDTGTHCEEVGDLARAVAPAVGLDRAAVDELDLAAQLHDLGKTDVPISILRKRGPLTPKEWELVHEHPGRGAQMLAELPGLAPVGWLVRHHHERWDGTGYPDRIGSEQIPLGSRIIGACDAFLAMVRDRPYRAAMDRRSAVQELHRGAGEQFDPRVVDALVATVG